MKGLLIYIYIYRNRIGSRDDSLLGGLEKEAKSLGSKPQAIAVARSFERWK